MKSKNVNDFIKEWNDTLEMLNDLRGEHSKIIQIIDIEMRKLENKPVQVFLSELNPWMRIAIRSIVATIEALCYKLKKTTILICDHKNKRLTSTERQKLIEVKRDKNGKLRNYYLKTDINVKFTLKMIYYSLDVDFEITDQAGWQNLKNTIEIRNRLTHPKYSNDLKVSTKEYQDAVQGFDWFDKHIKQLTKQD